MALVVTTSAKLAPQLPESLPFHTVMGVLGAHWTLVRLWASLYPDSQCGRRDLALGPAVLANGL